MCFFTSFQWKINPFSDAYVG
ncbi:hypothetical protein CAT7_09385 [Carnobacterium sp. AT7]|nr:hypothetical protein CAT7_09385 [Carnobacterium sp. AT7]